jgi:CPA2 family monovalent cation:H+ antiporter-2
VLALVGFATKMATGWYAARASGLGTSAGWRAGTTLVARGEFSIVIASLGAGLAKGERLGAVAAGFVLLTALAGPMAARSVERFRPERAGD